MGNRFDFHFHNGLESNYGFVVLRHAFITGTSTRILRYLDHPLKLNGTPDLRAKDDVVSRMMDFNDGMRVRHWVDGNSVKAYNELNVLRVEMTMNKPEKFRVHRHKQGQSDSEKNLAFLYVKALLISHYGQ